MGEVAVDPQGSGERGQLGSAGAAAVCARTMEAVAKSSRTAAAGRTGIRAP